MKAHVGVDSKTKLVHSAVAAANVADSTVLAELLHVALGCPIDGSCCA